MDEYFATKKSFLNSNKNRSQVHTPGKAFRCQDLHEDVSENHCCAPTNSQTGSDCHSHSDDHHEHCETHSSCCDSHSEHGEEADKKPLQVGATPFIFTPAEASSKPASQEDTDLDINFDADFTPSTPYVHKFRTEMCKNFALGNCKYGD